MLLNLKVFNNNNNNDKNKITVIILLLNLLFSVVRKNIFSAVDCGDLFGSVVLVISLDKTGPGETKWWSRGWTVIVFIYIYNKYYNSNLYKTN